MFNLYWIFYLKFLTGLQVVLEVYEARVRTGGAVYEEGHTLVLGWCENQRDEETMWKLLSQVTSDLVAQAADQAVEWVAVRELRRSGGRCSAR